MTEGLLWFDDSNLELEAKILEAAERYEEKFGVRPNHCYVNPGCLPDAGFSVTGIRISASPGVLPNHLWIGIHQEEEPAERRSERVA